MSVFLFHNNGISVIIEISIEVYDRRHNTGDIIWNDLKSSDTLYKIFGETGM